MARKNLFSISNQLIIHPLLFGDSTAHGKYRGWNGSTVEISCWAELARSSAGIKNRPKNLCSHVIFIVFFKFYIEIAGGDGINQFLLKIRGF